MRLPGPEVATSDSPENRTIISAGITMVSSSCSGLRSISRTSCAACAMIMRKAGAAPGFGVKLSGAGARAVSPAPVLAASAVSSAEAVVVNGGPVR